MAPPGPGPQARRTLATFLRGKVARPQAKRPPVPAHRRKSLFPQNSTSQNKLSTWGVDNLFCIEKQKRPRVSRDPEAQDRPAGRKNTPTWAVFQKNGRNTKKTLTARERAWYNKMLLWPNRAKLPLLDRERSLTWQRKNDKSKHRETNHLAGCAEKRSPTGIVQNHKRHGRFSLHPGENPDRTNRGSNRKRVDF